MRDTPKLYETIRALLIELEHERLVPSTVPGTIQLPTQTPQHNYSQRDSALYQLKVLNAVKNIAAVTDSNGEYEQGYWLLELDSGHDTARKDYENIMRDMQDFQYVVYDGKTADLLIGCIMTNIGIDTKQADLCKVVLKTKTAQRHTWERADILEMWNDHAAKPRQVSDAARRVNDIVASTVGDKNFFSSTGKIIKLNTRYL